MFLKRRFLAILHCKIYIFSMYNCSFELLLTLIVCDNMQRKNSTVYLPKQFILILQIYDPKTLYSNQRLPNERIRFGQNARRSASLTRF